jgi:hypothetical protein
MSAELHLVSPAELRHVWAQVRDRVAALADKHNQPWIADDVFHELLVGNSHMWALDDLSGFLVLRVFATLYERTCHAWICCNASSDRIADYLEQLKGIAEDNDCTRITWESDRKYHRALPGVRVSYAYSIDVGG